MRMCAVPAGSFLMGDDLRRVEAGACEVGGGAGTNVQFLQFVQHGCGARAVWPPEGWEWRERNGIVKPRFFDEPEWQAYLAPDQPGVGVSWYGAAGFGGLTGAPPPRR